MDPVPTIRAENEAWRSLGKLRTRLKTDFFLYQVEDRNRLARFGRALDSLQQCPDVAEAQRWLGEDAPVVLMLMGHRADAQGILEGRQQERPADGRITHQLALLCYATAQHNEEDGKYEQATEAWRTAIANWVRTLADDAYWEAWCGQRQTYYGERPVDYLSAESKAVVREELLQHLMAEFTDYADRYARDGNPARARSHRELATLHTIEQEGAKAMKAAGGMKLSDGRELVCGLMLLRKLKLEPQLAVLAADRQRELDRYCAMDLAAALFADTDTNVSGEVVERLRFYFSLLAPAAALLSLNQPEDAASKLPSWSPPPGEFDQQNPAYSGLADKDGQFRRDGAELAIQSQISIARRHLASLPPDWSAAKLAWREAMARGQAAGIAGAAVKAINDLAIGRAHALKDDSQRDKTERLKEAVAVLEAATGVLPEASAGEVVSALVNMLSYRGQRRTERLGDFKGAVADLDQAFRLQSDRPEIRDELCTALIGYALERAEDNRGEALSLLERARNLANAGLKDHPESEDLNETLKWAQAELDKLRGIARAEDASQDPYKDLERAIEEVKSPDDGSGQSDIAYLIKSAESRMKSRDYAGAVADLDQALRLNPDHDGARTSIIQSYAMWARRCLEGGSVREAKEKIKLGMQYSPDAPALSRLEEQIRFTEQLLGPEEK